MRKLRAISSSLPFSLSMCTWLYICTPQTRVLSVRYTHFFPGRLSAQTGDDKPGNYYFKRQQCTCKYVRVFFFSIHIFLSTLFVRLCVLLMLQLARPEHARSDTTSVCVCDRRNTKGHKVPERPRNASSSAFRS